MANLATVQRFATRILFRVSLSILFYAATRQVCSRTPLIQLGNEWPNSTTSLWNRMNGKDVAPDYSFKVSNVLTAPQPFLTRSLGRNRALSVSVVHWLAFVFGSRWLLLNGVLLPIRIIVTIILRLAYGLLVCILLVCMPSLSGLGNLRRGIRNYLNFV